MPWAPISQPGGHSRVMDAGKQDRSTHRRSISTGHARETRFAQRALKKTKQKNQSEQHRTGISSHIFLLFPGKAATGCRESEVFLVFQHPGMQQRETPQPTKNPGCCTAG